MSNATEVHALFGVPTAGFNLSDAVARMLPRSPTGTIVRLGFPFVSGAGVETLTHGLGGNLVWPVVEKTWLVGISQAVTEPAALEELCRDRTSKVRLFIPTGEVSERALLSRPIFHAKVVALEHSLSKRGARQLGSLVVGSANLTKAAIGNKNANFEAGALVTDPPRTMRSDWQAWWRSAWKMGVPATPSRLDKYARIRERVIQANPVLLENADPPTLSGVVDAAVLWIEAGAMSGGSRNQVEFSRELACFFGVIQSRRQKLLAIRAKATVHDNRPLTPKETTFGVEIWRLSLPTHAAGGFDYPGTVLCFRRQRDGSFQLDVAPPGSSKAREWRRRANRIGYLGLTSGSREYGVF